MRITTSRSTRFSRSTWPLLTRRHPASSRSHAQRTRPFRRSTRSTPRRSSFRDPRISTELVDHLQRHRTRNIAAEIPRARGGPAE